VPISENLEHIFVAIGKPCSLHRCKHPSSHHHHHKRRDYRGI